MMGSGLQLPSMSEMFQQRRSAQQLTQELDGRPHYNGPAIPGMKRVYRASSGASPEETARQQLIDDYTRAGRALEAINGFLEQYFSDTGAEQDQAPASMTPARTQPQGTTGYYTNETGSFYHLNPGDRYYGE